MHTLANRLNSLRLSIRDQAEYLQDLLDQFDIPYDACCCLQVTVDELRAASQKIHFLALHLPKELRAPSTKDTTRRRSES